MQATTVELARLPNHRKAPLAIPAGAAESAAAVLSFVKTGQAPERSAAIEAYRLRVDGLLNLADPHALKEELSAHAALLDALFLRLTVDAIESQNFEVRARYLKLALNAQAASLRTLALLGSMATRSE